MCASCSKTNRKPPPRDRPPCYAASVPFDSHNASPDSVNLSELARDAMLERGLEPEFPPAAIHQAQQLDGAARDSSIQDQRRLTWCSIDNDDSRDLDQLTVGERLEGGVILDSRRHRGCRRPRA
jgi:hypothetical protein